MKKTFLFLLISLSAFISQLKAQDIVGKWVIDDISISIGQKQKVTEVDKMQMDMMKKDFLEFNKGKTTEEYKSDGTFIQFMQDESGEMQASNYKWWVKDGKLYTSNPLDPKGYEATYKVVDSKLYITKIERAHSITIIVTYKKVE